MTVELLPGSAHGRPSAIKVPIALSPDELSAYIYLSKAGILCRYLTSFDVTGPGVVPIASSPC